MINKEIVKTNVNLLELELIITLETKKEKIVMKEIKEGLKKEYHKRNRKVKILLQIKI